MDAIEREITLPVDLDEAWDLLTRPEDLEAWLGREVVLDPTPGAAGRVVDHDGSVRRLVVDHVVPGRRLAWHWWDDDAPEHSSRVVITVAPVEQGTAVRVVEEAVGAPVAQARAGAGEAWSHRLLHLEALLLIAAAVRG
jgi:uncharacterized protein YndB with AHSA1/START domain